MFTFMVYASHLAIERHLKIDEFPDGLFVAI